jgi:hypothetical protein
MRRTGDPPTLIGKDLIDPKFGFGLAPRVPPRAENVNHPPLESSCTDSPPGEPTALVERLEVVAMFLGADILELLKHAEIDPDCGLFRDSETLARALIRWGAGGHAELRKLG